MCVLIRTFLIHVNILREQLSCNLGQVIRDITGKRHSYHGNLPTDLRIDSYEIHMVQHVHKYTMYTNTAAHSSPRLMVSAQCVTGE